MNVFKRFVEVHRNIRKNTDEILWAQTWRDTKKGIQWIENLPSISPGRWAVGYNYLYVMTRILNELQPHSVLDLGLGVSSTLISCYFTFKDDKEDIHTIVEHNNDWIRFYLKQHPLSKASNIIICNCVEEKINGQPYYVYEGLKERLANKKYSVISVDGPIGSDKYSRRDILKLLPTILEDSFVIVFDDVNRIGEQKTIDEIKSILKDEKIMYHTGIYSGESDCCVIASDDNQYFCSL